MGFAIFSLIAAVLTLLPSVIFVRRAMMQNPGSGRVAYRLSFPADLPADQVLTWLSKMSGISRSGPARMGPGPSLVFEVWANNRGVKHRLHVPKELESYVVPQLRSLVPGMTATPETEEPAHQWTTAVEWKQHNLARGLGIDRGDVEPLSTSLLTNLQPLGAKEEVLIQWVVTPAVQERLPAQAGGDMKAADFKPLRSLLVGQVSADRDEIAERRTKLSEPNFLGVLRLAVKAADNQHAQRLLSPLRHTLRSIGTAHNRLKPRTLVSQGRAVERISHAHEPAIFPAQVAATELVGLMGWPVGQSYIAGVARSRTRHLPASGAVLSKGRVLARSNFPTDPRLIALDPVESAQHLQVVGPTGSGKTALLENLIVQDMAANRGVVLIESKGDLFHRVLTRVPKHRLHDVVLVDVTDTEYPVGFNILQGNPYAVAADIQRLFDHLYPQDARGVRVRQGFYHLILTLMMSKNAPGPMTFADIGPLSVPRAGQEVFADELIRGVSHIDELAGWWQEITNLPRNQRDMYFKPLTDRTWQLTNRRSLRNIIGQSNSTIDLRQVLSEKKILLVNTGRATEGKDTAGLFSSLVLNGLWSMVQAGATDPTNPTMLYLDEFQDYLNLPISPNDMFAQARSMGLAMTVAHQFVGQLSRELQDATQNNARSKIVFQTSADEGRYFARQFGRSVTEDDFINQQRFEVIMRLATVDGVSAPITGVTLPPGEPTGLADQARLLSRQKYSRPLEDVEAEISARRGARPTAKKKTPKFGGPR
ncbi:type IV secretory system conjugative DNA transfer family protein [Streptomyces sp. NPDC048392]|uniref:type IV secretory system conjugative DNA transfer family protein n=1 Tax=Streptomyces sp. NPDC048392 TaxID=3365543 RepID=UPI00371F1058